ncbi:hypothetical protein LCGC14_2653760, partial [marine sediment metagenome]
FNEGPPGDVFIEVQVQNPDLSGLSDEERGTLKELLSKKPRGRIWIEILNRWVYYYLGNL